MRLHRWTCSIAVFCFGLPAACAAVAADRPAAVLESARDIPVAYDVDVVVVGGSTGAVSAAVAAKEAGAKVFLLAPRPYLGEDMCETRRLWLEEDEKPASPLAAALSRGAERSRACEAAGPAPEGFVRWRPMHVKRTLDEAMLEAKVDFLFSCFPLGVAPRRRRQAVRAGDGQPRPGGRRSWRR